MPSAADQIARIAAMAKARGIDDDKFSSPEIIREGRIPVVDALPSPGEITRDAYSEADLVALLDRYKIIPSADEMRADMMAYVARVSQASGDAYWELIEDVLKRDTLIELTRAVTTRYDTMIAMMDETGRLNESQVLVRISEGDEQVCEACVGLAGLEGPIGVHIEAGLPGATSCLGGNRCRCQLVAVG